MTLLKTIPPYWAPIRAQFYKPRRRSRRRPRAGSSSTERSPLSQADKIVKPLLIGQGANDPRVKQAESDQIVKAMQSKRSR